MNKTEINKRLNQLLVDSIPQHIHDEMEYVCEQYDNDKIGDYIFDENEGYRSNSTFMLELGHLLNKYTIIDRERLKEIEEMMRSNLEEIFIELRLTVENDEDVFEEQKYIDVQDLMFYVRDLIKMESYTEYEIHFFQEINHILDVECWYGDDETVNHLVSFVPVRSISYQ